VKPSWQGAGILSSPAARRTIQVAIVALTVIFFGLAVYSQLPKILSYHWVVDPALLVLAFFLLLLRGPTVTYGWWSTLKLLGHRLPFSKAIRISYHSALARYLPGQVWYAVSRVYLAEKEGVPRVVTLVSVGLETAFLVIGAGLVASLSLLVWKDAPIWLGLVVVALFGVLIAHPDLLFNILNWGLRSIGRNPIEARLTRGDVLRLLWQFSLNWLHYAVMSFVLTAALYPSLPWSDLPAVTGLFTAAWLVGFLAILVPQGLIVREGMVVFFLTSLLGVPTPVAAAAALLSRLWTILGEGIWAAVSTRF